MKELFKILVAMIMVIAISRALEAQEIFDAVQKNDMAKMKELIEKNPQLIITKANNGQTTLHIAAISGSKETTEWLISKGADLEAIDNANNTPLTNAIFRRNSDAAKVLIERGANVNKHGLWNWLPIQVAAEFGPKEIVELLIEKGADIPVEQGPVSYQLLNASCSRGLEKLFEILVERGFDLQLNQYTSVLLHLAAEGGSEKIVGVLLDKGFKVMSGNEFGWSPLHCAAEKGNLKVVALLLEKGADINDRSVSGMTPFNLAEFYGHKNVCDFLLSKGADESEQKFPELRGEYLGQKKSENRPRVFAVDIVSTKYMIHGNIVFSPDGKEAYWSGTYPSKGSLEPKYQILTIKIENGKWSKPELASFCKIGYDDDCPFITPDGNKLFFLSRRSFTPGGENSIKENIWFVTRKGNGWSNPEPLEIVNSIDVHWQVSTDKMGNLYFGGIDPEGKQFSEIFYSKYENGKYLKPEKLGNTINSENHENSPYISPEGDYLLFSRASRMGAQMGLYISFQKTDGTWTEAQSITETAQISPSSQCCYVTPDGNYLFYLSWYRSEFAVYWVDAKIIEALRPKK